MYECHEMFLQLHFACNVLSAVLIEIKNIGCFESYQGIQCIHGKGNRLNTRWDSVQWTKSSTEVLWAGGSGLQQEWSWQESVWIMESALFKWKISVCAVVHPVARGLDGCGSSRGKGLLSAAEATCIHPWPLWASEGLRIDIKTKQNKPLPVLLKNLKWCLYACSRHCEAWRAFRPQSGLEDGVRPEKRVVEHLVFLIHRISGIWAYL